MPRLNNWIYSIATIVSNTNTHSFTFWLMQRSHILNSTHEMNTQKPMICDFYVVENVNMHITFKWLKFLRKGRITQIWVENIRMNHLHSRKHFLIIQHVSLKSGRISQNDFGAFATEFLQNKKLYEKMSTTLSSKWLQVFNCSWWDFIRWNNSIKSIIAFDVNVYPTNP